MLNNENPEKTDFLKFHLNRLQLLYFEILNDKEGQKQYAILHQKLKAFEGLFSLDQKNVTNLLSTQKHSSKVTSKEEIKKYNSAVDDIL